MSDTKSDYLPEIPDAELAERVIRSEEIWRPSQIEVVGKAAARLGRALLAARLKWRKRDPEQLFTDGDQLLVAVPVRDQWNKLFWEYAIVAVHCDSEYFAVTCNGDPWGWDINDVQWWIPMTDIAPPEGP